MKKACLLTIEVEYDDDRIRFNKNGDLTKKSESTLFPNKAADYHAVVEEILKIGSVYDIFAISQLTEKQSGELTKKITDHTKLFGRFLNLNDLVKELTDSHE